MTLTHFVIIAVCAYLFGSLSFAIIVSKVTLGKDIRNYGSGNAGMTHTITKGGTYLIGEGATGAITVQTAGEVVLVGGGVGAWLGMELFRHKTQHRAFRICVPLFTLIWIVVVGGLYLYFNVIR